MTADSMESRRPRGIELAGDPASERSWVTWFGVGGGMATWGAHHGISYGLTAWFVCGQGGRLVLGGATLIAAALVIASLVAAWRTWKRANNGFDTDLHGIGSVNGFLGLAGLTTGLIALTGIVYNGMSVIFLNASC